MIKRQVARTRALIAASQARHAPFAPIAPAPVERSSDPSALAVLLRQAKLPVRRPVFIALCVLSGVVLSALLAQLLSLSLLPLFFLLGAFLPYSWMNARISARVARFCDDYPTVLLAAASSLKTGLSPHLALERSTTLISPASEVRREIDSFLEKTRRGVSREQALQEFAADIRLPDLELFRSAFLLLLENGGRFAPTLERLAAVTRDRTSLISSARVSTAVMRMTAHVLLTVTPLIVGIIAARTPDYWQLFRSHPVANVLGSIGIVTIAASYLTLRRMSDFKP